MVGRHILTSLWFIGLVGGLAQAADPPATTATPYQVVPGWPATPDSIRWGAVSAVAADSDDHIYVFHRGEHPVVVFDRQGAFLQSWGDGQIKKAHGLRIDHENNVWITDIGDHVVRKFTRDGRLLVTLGTPGEAGDGPTHFNQPTDVSVSPSGAFFVTDGYGNARVVAFSQEGKYLREWGKKGTGEGEFHLPHAIGRDQRGRLYVGDRENNRVQVFEPDGKFVASWTAGGAPYGLGLAVDGRLFVADGRANRVTVLDPNGRVLTRWGQAGDEPGQFLMPHAVCLDSRGDVYVAEINGKRAQKFTSK